MDDDPEPYVEPVTSEHLLNFGELQKYGLEHNEGGDNGPEATKKGLCPKKAKDALYKEVMNLSQSSDISGTQKSSSTSARKTTRRNLQRLPGQEAQRSGQPSSGLKSSRMQSANEPDAKEITWVSQRSGKLMKCNSQQTNLIWEQRGLSGNLNTSSEESERSRWEDESDEVTSSVELVSTEDPSGNEASRKRQWKERKAKSTQPHLDSHRLYQRSTAESFLRTMPKGKAIEEEVPWISPKTGKEMKNKAQQTSIVWELRTLSEILHHSSQDSLCNVETDGTDGEDTFWSSAETDWELRMLQRAQQRIQPLGTKPIKAPASKPSVAKPHRAEQKKPEAPKPEAVAATPYKGEPKKPEESKSELARKSQGQRFDEVLQTKTTESLRREMLDYTQQMSESKTALKAEEKAPQPESQDLEEKPSRPEFLPLEKSEPESEAETKPEQEAEAEAEAEAEPETETEPELEPEQEPEQEPPRKTEEPQFDLTPQTESLRDLRREEEIDGSKTSFTLEQQSSRRESQHLEGKESRSELQSLEELRREQLDYGQERDGSRASFAVEQQGSRRESQHLEGKASRPEVQSLEELRREEVDYSQKIDSSKTSFAVDQQDSRHESQHLVGKASSPELQSLEELRREHLDYGQERDGSRTSFAIEQQGSRRESQHLEGKASKPEVPSLAELRREQLDYSQKMDGSKTSFAVEQQGSRRESQHLEGRPSRPEIQPLEELVPRPELPRKKQMQKIDRTQQTDSADSLKKDLRDYSQQVDRSDSSLTAKQQSQKKEAPISRHVSQDLKRQDSQPKNLDFQRHSQQSLGHEAKMPMGLEREIIKLIPEPVPAKDLQWRRDSVPIEEGTWISRKTGKLVRNQIQQTDKSWLQYYAAQMKIIKKCCSQQTDESFLQSYGGMKVSSQVTPASVPVSQASSPQSENPSYTYASEDVTELSFSKVQFSPTQSTTSMTQTPEEMDTLMDIGEEEAEWQETKEEEMAGKLSNGEMARVPEDASTDGSMYSFVEGEDVAQQTYSIISLEDGIWMNRRTGKLLVSRSQQTSQTAVPGALSFTTFKSGSIEEESFRSSNQRSYQNDQDTSSVEEESQSTDDVEKLLSQRLSEAMLLSAQSPDTEDDTIPLYTAVEEGSWLNMHTGKLLASQRLQTDESADQLLAEEKQRLNMGFKETPEKRQVEQSYFSRDYGRENGGEGMDDDP